MKLMQYTTVEGGEWNNWPFDSTPPQWWLQAKLKEKLPIITWEFRPGVTISFHSLAYQDGFRTQVWDTINGWRGPKEGT